MKDNLSHDLKFTAHADAINDVAFPHGCSKLFATASKEDIRVWVADTGVVSAAVVAVVVLTVVLMVVAIVVVAVVGAVKA